MGTRIKGAKSKEISTAEPAPEVAASEQPQMIEAATQSGEQEASLHGWNEDEADALEAALGEADAEAGRTAEPQHEGSMPLDSGGYISREAWPEVMAGFFHIASALTRLQSLFIDKADPAYREAAYAVWDICRETPYMDFLIKPGGKWMQRAAAIAAFGLPVYMGCKAEIAARRAKPVNENRPGASSAPGQVMPEPGAWAA